MKKKLKNLLRFLPLFITLNFLICSCQSNFNDEISCIDDCANSEIAQNVASMKKEGLFDSILLEARSACSDDDIVYLERFITETDSVLEEISTEENGQEKIDVISKLFCGASVQDFASSFSKLDSEKAEEFLTVMNENFNVSEDSSARTASNLLLTLCYANLFASSSLRTAYANDLSWNTIGWYSGFCAATVAGFYLASYGGLWTRIAGMAAALAGAGSMAVQLGKWVVYSELGTFVSGMLTQDNSKINAKSDSSLKFLTIASLTVGTLIACAVTPFGISLIKGVVSLYNEFVDVLISMFPKGISYKILEFPLKKIENFNSLTEFFAVIKSFL